MITSRESKLVTAEVDGRIDQVIVQHGQRVTGGSRLVIVDDTEMRRQLDAARGAEEAALGELSRAATTRAEAARVMRQQRALLRDGAVSRDAAAAATSAHAIAGAQVATASGALKRARAARAQAEQALAKTTITAPMDGVITLVRVSNGQMVQRGQPIARVFDPKDLWVRFAIQPSQRDSVKDGTKVTVTPVTPGAKSFTATVRVVHRTLEPPLQLAVVEADFDDATLPDHDTMLGAMVDVRIE